jgi:hypothetical protein
VRIGLTEATRRYDPAVLDAAPFMAFIPVGDPALARFFYGEILGLRVEDENPFAVILDSGGTTLRLTKVEDPEPQSFTVAGWEVSNIGDTIDALVNRRVPFIRYDGMDQDQRGVWTTPGSDQRPRWQHTVAHELQDVGRPRSPIMWIAP